MGYFNTIQSGNLQAASDYVNEQKKKQDEEAWAKQKEEERRVERVKDKSSSSKKSSGVAQQVQQQVNEQKAQENPDWNSVVEQPAAPSGSFTNSQARSGVTTTPSVSQSDVKGTVGISVAAAQEEQRRMAEAEERNRQAEELRKQQEEEQRRIAEEQARREQERIAQMQNEGLQKSTERAGSGYVPTNILYSDNFNKITEYDPKNTQYDWNGQAREVGIDENGNIYDRPLGISTEQAQWLNTEAGRTALANQNAKRQNDYTISEAITPDQADVINKVSGYTTPRIYDPKEMTEALKEAGIPVDTAQSMNDLYEMYRNYLANQEAAEENPNDTWGNVIDVASALNGNGYVTPVTPNRASESGTKGMVFGGAAQPAANGYPDVVPSVTTPKGSTQEPTLEEIQQAYVNDPTKGPQLETPSLKGVIQNALDNWLLSRNGNTAPQAETEENGTFSPMQMDYILNPNTGPEMPDSMIPSFGDVVGEIPFEEATRDAVNATGDYLLNNLMGEEFADSPYAKEIEQLGDDFLRTLVGDEAADKIIGPAETADEKRERLEKLNEYLSNNGYNPDTYNAYVASTNNDSGKSQKPETNDEKRERLAKETEQMLANGGGSNYRMIDGTPAYNADGTPNDVLLNMMNGGWNIDLGLDSVIQHEGDAERILNSFDSENGFTGITIPKGYEKYFADNKWTSAGDLDALSYGLGGNVINTANPQNVQTVDATDAQMIEAMNALLDANPVLQDLVKSGQLDQNDIARHFMKANATMAQASNEDIPTYYDYVNNTQTAQNYMNGGSTGTGGTSGSNNRLGTIITPSYGQDMTNGVKLPYKQGGYTEAELRNAGNVPYTTSRGYTGYEGYYYNTYDGKWYPVDQEKAAYYQKYHTYDGWQEPMRDYYNTWGTFYGYRPDWKTAGGKNTWKVNNNVYENYRPAKNSGSKASSYSGGSSSGGTGSSKSSSNAYANHGYYDANTNSYVDPTMTNQTRQRINNIMRNWTF